MTGGSKATIFSLQDSWRPGLSSGDKRLTWWGGGPAFVLASSGAVRLNFRGVFTYGPKSIVRQLDKGLGWHGIPCNVSAWALCSSEAGHVFPATNPRMPEQQQSVAVDGWNDLGCSQSTGKILVSLGAYDISACDVVDEGLDLLYTSGMVYHRHTSMPLWEYWVTVVLPIVLVRCLSYNIQSLWLPPGETVVQTQWVPLGSSLSLMILLLLDGDSIYITTADQIFYWSTVAYVSVYLSIHAISRLSQHARNNTQNPQITAPKEAADKTKELHGQYEQPVFNVIIGTLQLVAMRFYTAAESPYNTVLVAMLASRVW